MSGAQEAKCDITGTSVCTSDVHRQIRALKSRWQMRWAALEETITAERDKREAIKQIFEMISCKATPQKLSKKARKRREPNWMSNPICPKLIREFLRTIWPDPLWVDEDVLRYEWLVLDAYYGDKLLYLIAGEDDFLPEFTDMSTLRHQLGVIPKVDVTIASSTGSESVVHVQTTDQAPSSVPPAIIASNGIQTSPITAFTENKYCASNTVTQSATEEMLIRPLRINMGDVVSARLRPGFPRVIDDRALVSSVVENNIFQVRIGPWNLASWYAMEPYKRWFISNCYNYAYPCETLLPTPRSLTELLKQCAKISPDHTLSRDHLLKLQVYSMYTIINGDYELLNVIRSEQNFIVYEAKPGFWRRYGTFILTSIRCPRDYTQVACDIQTQKARKSYKKDIYGSEKPLSMNASVSKSSRQLLADKKKMIDAQKKYIVRLIKKRQATESYLHTFAYDGLIWIVQRNMQCESRPISGPPYGIEKGDMKTVHNEIMEAERHLDVSQSRKTLS